jgi:NAD(P)-dependent dehydrogenase (short-subunit alcohol dehydrogenase family)
MRGLKDIRVLITGGASGIGAATAERFLNEGACVVVLDCNDKGLSDIKKELPSLFATINADVSDVDDVTHAFSELDRLLGGLDVLINNAGISFRKPVTDITPQQWCRVIAVNLNGVFFVAQQAARDSWLSFLCRL